MLAHYNVYKTELNITSPIEIGVICQLSYCYIMLPAKILNFKESCSL